MPRWTPFRVRRKGLVGAPVRCAPARPPYYTCGGHLLHLAGSPGALLGGRAAGWREFIEN
jgi:hypothetical protein